MQKRIYVSVILMFVWLLLFIIFQKRSGATNPRRVENLVHHALNVFAAMNILLVLFYCLNHLKFPMSLDVLEGTLIQEFWKAAEFKPIYPEPSPEYVPVAYNPLYFYLSLPFTKFFGVSLVTLRFVSILAYIGSGLILYQIVKERTNSAWWAFMSLGLFAASYRALDASMDNAKTDALYLFFALYGTYLIGKSESKVKELVGISCLLISFWIKQPGALFVMGGLIYITLRRGFFRSLPAWFIVLVMGPLMYIFAGRFLFGSNFHYFTWELPRQWAILDSSNFYRYILYIVNNYPLLVISGIALFIVSLTERKTLADIWLVQFAVALVSGLLSTLDHDSSDNIFIPMAVWLILVGTLGLHWFTEILKKKMTPAGYRLFPLFASFCLLIYNPIKFYIPPSSHDSYNDLISILNRLPGPVYAPSIGQIENDYKFSPPIHWAALEDMIRGKGRETENHPKTRKLLEPVLNPYGQKFILSNWPLEKGIPVTRFLAEQYVLEMDYGDRFKYLGILNKKFSHKWPRYLYRNKNYNYKIS